MGAGKRYVSQQQGKTYINVCLNQYEKLLCLFFTPLVFDFPTDSDLGAIVLQCVIRPLPGNMALCHSLPLTPYCHLSLQLSTTKIVYRNRSKGCIFKTAGVVTS